ncbi:TonB-dependent receptor domain-containing protein, partial [Aliarcobacter butzleri]
YEITPNSLIYANYGKASRMGGIIPFTWLTQIYKDRTYSDDLQAEKSTRYEAGYKYDKNGIFATDDYFSFNANIFKTKIK